MEEIKKIRRGFASMDPENPPFTRSAYFGNNKALEACIIQNWQFSLDILRGAPSGKHLGGAPLDWRNSRRCRISHDLHIYI